MTQTPQRIVIVDDHPLLRRGLRDLLALEPSLALVGEAADGETALALVAETDPDLILLDMKMPGMSGLDTLKALRQAGHDGRILMFTVSDDQQDVLDALRAGADGYLLKDMEPEKLVEQLHQAATGQLAISPELTRLLAEALRRKPAQGLSQEASKDALTQREKDVLKRVALGHSNKMIARQLDITEGTVKVHVKHLLAKLGLRSRTQAAVWVSEQNARL